jgi:hypothetical protein
MIFYSFWVLVLLILQLLHIIQFSCIPSAILASVGTIILDIIRYYKGILTYKVFILSILIHIPPFLLVPLKFGRKDIFMNMAVLVLFFIYMFIAKITPKEAINAMLYNAPGHI